MSLKEDEGGYSGGKFQVHSCFGFALEMLQLFQHPENVKFQFFNLPILSTNAISPEVFNEFFKSFFFLLKEEEPGYCGWKFKVHVRRYFRFAVATLQLFQHREIVNISILLFTKCKYFNFSIYQFPAEMLYLQKYLKNFLKLF